MTRNCDAVAMECRNLVPESTVRNSLWGLISAEVEDRNIQ